MKWIGSFDLTVNNNHEREVFFFVFFLVFLKDKQPWAKTRFTITGRCFSLCVDGFSQLLEGPAHS